MAAKDCAERVGLGIAQGGKLYGGVDDRAGVLADLHDRTLVGGGLHDGSVASLGQCLGDHRRCKRDIARRDRPGRHQAVSPLAGKGIYARLPLGSLNEAQGIECQAVIALAQGRPTLGGEAVNLAGTSATSGWRGPERRPIGGTDQAVLGQRGQGSPDTGRCLVQALGKLRGSSRPVKEQAGKPLSSLTGEFHNASVAYIRKSARPGSGIRCPPGAYARAVTVDASLRVRDLTIRYGDLLAVRGVDLVAQPATVTALLGPNGAGKTSTVEACCGLRQPTSGSVTLLGGSPADSRIRARIGVMLQSGGLYPTARPLEWLRHLARLYAHPADPRTLLEQVGIDPSTRTVTRRLSGGEAQRVALAAALLPRPDVLFLDEPTAGLDPLARRSLIDLLRRTRDSGTCILLTSHQLADVEDLADQVIVVGAGTVTARGSIAELIGADEGVTFDGPAGLETSTLSVLLPVGYEVIEVRSGRYVVRGRPEPAVMSAVATWCAKNGALAGGLRPGLRTLEDLIESAAQEPR